MSFIICSICLIVKVELNVCCFGNYQSRNDPSIWIDPGMMRVLEHDQQWYNVTRPLDMEHDQQWCDVTRPLAMEHDQQWYDITHPLAIKVLILFDDFPFVWGFIYIFIVKLLLLHLNVELDFKIWMGLYCASIICFCYYSYCMYKYMMMTSIRFLDLIVWY